MKVSLNWLKEYVDLSDMNPDEVLDKLTYAGLEVEEVVDQSRLFENMVVGFVKERKKHPNADKLSLCIVTDGKMEYNVVCGAPNVASGQKVAFAKIGSIIPNGQLKIEKAKIRGEVSEGMICSERELGISDNHEGIIVLADECKVGEDLAKAVGMDDITFEVNITPNRADALSHIGIARDLAAIFKRELKYPEIKYHESKVKSAELASVEILDPVNCPRYIGKVVSNVTIKESPQWLKNRLKSIGLRPINNVVDVTNFVLHEIGQPLHAFDLDNLTQKKIIVRLANDNEKFTTLDSKERTLKSIDLMICDGEKSVALAGVMGGENSEVTSNTKNILIESAYFKPSTVRKTAKHLGLSTDASYRFERGVDFDKSLWAAQRAAQLIQETAGGEIALGEIDAYPNIIKNRTATIRFARTNKILGYEINPEEIESILVRLGFIIQTKDNEKLELQIPSYRQDVEREIDLIEEVARIFGYKNIPEVSKISITLEEKVDQSAFNDKVRSVLNSLGFYEIITNSMLSEDIASKFGNPIAVLNPQSSEMSHIRTSLMPGMLSTIAKNQKVNERDLQLFEIGKIINQKNADIKSFEDFTEEESLIAAISGNRTRTKWYEKDSPHDIYDATGFINTTISKLVNQSKIDLIPKTDEDKLLTNCLDVVVENKIVGVVGRIKDEICSMFDVTSSVIIAQLNLESLKNFQSGILRFTDLLKYPKVMRDFAFILDASITTSAVVEIIKESSSKLLHNVILFDIFQSESLGKGKKSLAFQLEFFDEKRTLTEEEVEKDFRTIIKTVETKFNAQLRGT